MLICQRPRAIFCLLKNEESHCNFKIYTTWGNSSVRVSDWPLCVDRGKSKSPSFTLEITGFIPCCIRRYSFPSRGILFGVLFCFLSTYTEEKRKEHARFIILIQFPSDFTQFNYIKMEIQFYFKIAFKCFLKRKFCIYQGRTEIIIQRHMSNEEN